MTKMQELELENLVLKNILDCISESLEELEKSDDTDKYCRFAGHTAARVSFYAPDVENALLWGHTVDYRDSAFYKNQPDGEPVKIYPSSGK